MTVCVTGMAQILNNQLKESISSSISEYELVLTSTNYRSDPSGVKILS